MTYKKLKQIIVRNGFCIEDFDDTEDCQGLYIYVPDEGGYWSTSGFYHPLANKTFATASFKYGEFFKISIYKDLILDDDKIYFGGSNGYEVMSKKITVDFLNKLCNTVKTNLQETKMKLKLKRIDEDFE